MNTEESIKNWSSVKNFTDEEVSKQKLEEVFELTTNAPTAFNLQPYRFIVLDSDDEKQKAVNSAVETNKWISDADKIVVLIGFEDIDRNSGKAIEDMIKNDRTDSSGAQKLKSMFEDYKTRSDEFLTGWLTRNTFIPATFFMLSCKSKGIGSCPVRGFDKEFLSEELSLPEKERPMLLIPIGYSEKDSRSWRRSPEKIFSIR